jgi:hypothetical protein
MFPRISYVLLLVVAWTKRCVTHIGSSGLLKWHSRIQYEWRHSIASAKSTALHIQKCMGLPLRYYEAPNPIDSENNDPAAIRHFSWIPNEILHISNSTQEARYNFYLSTVYF